MRLLRVVALAFASLAAAAALAQQPDPTELLAQAKQATGGAAWDALRSQHSRVAFTAARTSGVVERWASLTTGRSLLRYDIGAASGMQGFDGLAAWSQDAAGDVRIESDDETRELATNAAYRDRLAFWYPERQAARIEYARRDRAEGIDYDVVRIAPDGGRPYEAWIGMLTHRIERLTESEGGVVRTETYSDFRNVQGVTIPFRVRISRGNGHDEQYVVDAIEYNVALDDIDFGVPPPPPDDVAFASGSESVDVPFVVRNGHVFVGVKLNGKGPYRMLFDAGGASVLTPATATALGLKPQPVDNGVASVAIGRVDVGGVALERQTFAVLDVAPLMRRVEGVDDAVGVIGNDIVRRLPVTIDYEHSKLVLHRARGYRPAAGALRVPFAFDGRVARVRASVDGVGGAFALDTGSRASLTLAPAFVERNDLARKYGATREAVAGAGANGATRALLARAGKLTLGGADVDAPVTYLVQGDGGAFADPALAGNIGYGVLRRFNVTFDAPRKAVWLEKNGAFADPDVADRAGLWIERGERGFAVVDVVAGGPAEAAGIVAGDVIVAVDGKPAKSFALSDVRTLLRAAPGTKVRLKPERKGAKEAIVVLRDLV